MFGRGLEPSACLDGVGGDDKCGVAAHARPTSRLLRISARSMTYCRPSSFIDHITSVPRPARLLQFPTYPAEAHCYHQPRWKQTKSSRPCLTPPLVFAKDSALS